MCRWASMAKLINLDNGILEYPPMNKRQETHFEWHDGLDLCS